MKSKTGGLFCLVLLIFLAMPVRVQASGEEEFMQELDLEDIDETLDDLLDTESFSFTDAVKQLMTGEIPLTKEYLGKLAKDTLFSELGQHKKMAVHILVLIIVSAIFTNFTGAFGKSQVADISFYMMYLLLFTVLMRAFSTLSDSAAEALNQVLNFMKVLMPSYLIASVFACGSLSGAAYYEFTLFLVSMIQLVLKYAVIPAINFYVLFTLLNHISKEDYFSKMAELVQTFVSWTLKTLSAAAIGIQAVQCLILPAVDGLKTAVLNKTAGAIPGVGNIFNSVTEVVLGSAVLIKNAIGVAGLLVLAVICLIPIIKMAVCALIYKVISAVIQPAADKRMSECVGGVGEGAVMLLKVLTTTGILFFISVAMATASIRGGA